MITYKNTHKSTYSKSTHKITYKSTHKSTYKSTQKSTYKSTHKSTQIRWYLNNRKKYLTRFSEGIVVFKAQGPYLEKNITILENRESILFIFQ